MDVAQERRRKGRAFLRKEELKDVLDKWYIKLHGTGTVKAWVHVHIIQTFDRLTYTSRVPRVSIIKI